VFERGEGDKDLLGYKKKSIIRGNAGKKRLKSERNQVIHERRSEV